MSAARTAELSVCPSFYFLFMKCYGRSRTTEKSISETERASRESDRADRSLFMQELLLALMSETTDAIRTGTPNELEFSSSAEDLMLLDVDGLLSKSANSLAVSSQHGSTSSLTALCDDADSALVANSRPVENCEPVGKESFSVDVGNCGAAGGLEVACTKAGML